jgi:hypothetical protein
MGVGAEVMCTDWVALVSLWEAQTQEEEVEEAVKCTVIQ